MKKRLPSFIWIYLALLLAFQPMMLANAQTPNPPPLSTFSNSLENEDFTVLVDGDSSEEPPPEDDSLSGEPSFLVDSISELEWLIDDPDRLKLAAKDLKYLNEKVVDSRVTDYLVNMVAPVESGGQGLNHLKVERIFRNYDSQKGVGRFDREGDHEESDQVLSQHNRGQAVDISEVGKITCRLKQSSLLGSSSKPLPPRPILVAWQSRDGIVRHPTPRGNSLMEASGALTADGLTEYLNQTGELYAQPDFVKGADLGTILQYVGANIYLKQLGVKKVLSDPLADSLLHVIGGAVLQEAIPGLPGDFALGQNDDDARIAFAKARLEQGLALPAGSFRGYGWNTILEATGKRLIENSLGLPALYFEDKSLSDAKKLESVIGALGQMVANKDGAFNVPAGTMAMLENNQAGAFKFAGVNLLASALKLTDSQRQEVLIALGANREPAVDLSSAAIDGVISNQDLVNIFGVGKRSEAEQALKAMGTVIAKEAIDQIKSQPLRGITAALLAQLASPTSNLKLGELKDSIANATLAMTGDLEPNSLRGGLTASAAQILADVFNEEFELKTTGQLTGNDIRAIVNKGDYSVITKIAAAQADQAVGWHPGTALGIINKTKSLDDAAGEIIANEIGQLVGISTKGLSLTGNIPLNYGRALLGERLGLTVDLSQTADAAALLAGIGQAKFYQAFEINSSKTFTELKNDEVFWASEENQARWRVLDVSLGLSLGSTQSYLRGNATTNQLSAQSGAATLQTIAVDKLIDHFGLVGRYGLEKKDLENFVKVLTGSGSQSQLLATGLSIVGHAIEAKAGMTPGSFTQIINEKNAATRTQLMINEGIRYVAKAIGLDSGKFSYEQLEEYGNMIRQIFETGDFIGQIDVRAIVEAFANDAIGAFLIDQGIPLPEGFKIDVKALMRGDFRLGISAVSFTSYIKQVYDYLPVSQMLTYDELRDALIMNDQARIGSLARANYAANTANTLPFDSLGADKQQTLKDLARKEIMEESKKNAQYKISDGFLRKADRSIPVGFSKVMFTGTQEQKAEIIMLWGFGKIDSVLKGLEPSYVEGTLYKVYKHELSPQDAQAILANALMSRIGVDFGDFTPEFIRSFRDFSFASNQNALFTDSRFNSMWGAFDGFLERSLGIGGLESGIAKSIFYASQHNWDFNAKIDGMVKSLNQIGQSFFVNRVTQWADNIFRLPVGSTYQAYQSIKAVVDASKTIAAIADKASAAYGQASNNLRAAQAALAYFVIATALAMCNACQEFFGSIDRALGVPAGFTNALVLGAIGMALGLGPAGLFIAGFILVFGGGSVQYLCPIPPETHDVFAINNLDPPADQLTFVGSTSAVDHDGNNPDLWMSWARYNVGRLIDRTLSYGEERDRPFKPLQILTYRRANAEYFGPRSLEAFGPLELDNPTVGLGYSQDTTKTTDWVHVSFGGLF